MPRIFIPVLFILCILSSHYLLAQKGQPYLDSLLRELPKAKEDVHKAGMLYALSQGYYKAGEFPLSLQYSLRGYKLSEQLNDKELTGEHLENVGKNYQAIAESKYRKALPDSLAMLSVATRLQRAHYYIARTIDVQKETGNVDMLQDAYEHLSRVQLLQGDTAGSRESFRKYNNYLAGVYDKDKGNEVAKKDMKEAFTKKQDALKQEGEQKQLSMQKELEMNTLRYEYEKKQAEAKTGEERAQLKYEEELRQKQITFEYEKRQAKLETEKAQGDAMNALRISEAQKERNYYLAGLGMLGLVSIGMVNRFRVMRKNRKLLEEKNRQIAAEKEKADMLRHRAENSERFKQQFLANMSHEIRTPMNAVSGMTQILIDKAPRADQVAYLQAISRSSDILLHIINDILDLSKIEAGKMELETIDFSLADTIKQVKDTLSHRADDKGLQLLTTIDDDVADVVVGDPFRLNQVLINLGGNAIKFTEKGGVQLAVKHHKTDGDNIALCFSIVDTGIGIPEDKVGTLFQSFTQVNSSDTRRHGGTGLGLSISKQLVELHGGTIQVESKQGSGTTFSFTLNYKIGSPEKLRQRVNNEQVANGSILDGLRILVADDNEYNRMVVSETLQLKADVTIDMATNGDEALNLVKKKDFDVILMDVQMPVMNGLDATIAIRKLPGEPKRSVPIIALTASILRSDIDKCMESGMNSYVPKPFKAWQLINTIADVTGRKRPEGVAAHTAPADDMAQYAVPANTDMVTDDTYLHKFCEGDEERMKKYIGIYLKAVPVFKEKMLEALQAKDHKEISQRIHAFKPNWMIMGMKSTGELGSKIEHLCAEKDELAFTSVATLLGMIDQSVKELQRAD